MYTRTISISRFWRHLLFWLAFYLLYTKLGLVLYPDWNAVLVVYAGKILIQALAAYVLVYLFIPTLLYKRKFISFVIITTAWTYLIYALLVVSRAMYLEPVFTTFFSNSQWHIPVLNQSVFHRLGDFTAYLDAVPWLFTPAAFMGLIKFYRSQLQLLKIEEEKKGMELMMLKNRLHPHFLFNTLNNIYALTIKKDERAPIVIARLSDLLDFILYRCKDDLADMVTTGEMLENFIALEQLMYTESQLRIKYKQHADKVYKVPAPVLLTLLENAFKHSAVNETRTAYINISFSAENGLVNFRIENSKPATSTSEQNKKGGIGIKNIKEQLILLYPDRYELTMEDKQDVFTVNLVLHDA